MIARTFFLLVLGHLIGTWVIHYFPDISLWQGMVLAFLAGVIIVIIHNYGFTRRDNE